MERVTLRIPKSQLDQVEEMVEDGEFPNQSEAIRTALREMLNDYEKQDRPNRYGRKWKRAKL